MAAPAPLSDDVQWPDLECLRSEIQQKESELLALKRRLQAISQPSTPQQERRPSQSDDFEKPLSVVIPMGGLGTEFAEAGFRMPKPLVNIVGRPVSRLFSGIRVLVCFWIPIITYLAPTKTHTPLSQCVTEQPR